MNLSLVKLPNTETMKRIFKFLCLIPAPVIILVIAPIVLAAMNPFLTPIAPTWLRWACNACAWVTTVAAALGVWACVVIGGVWCCTWVAEKWKEAGE